jgi:hypothetical protein
MKAVRRSAEKLVLAIHWSLAMMLRTLKLVLGLTPMFVAALVVALGQRSLAQGDADLEAPGLASLPKPTSAGTTLFQNVRIFDGRNPTLSGAANVLVRGDTIERISSSPITVAGHRGEWGAC